MGERGNIVLRFLDRAAGIPLTLPAAFYRHASRLFYPAWTHTASPRIAILCLGAIGDLLLLSALANGIHEKMPDARIDVITSAANSGVIPLLKNISAGYPFSIRHPQRILRHMRFSKYDIIFDASQWARIGNILCNLSGARLTVGFDTRGQCRAAGYDHKVAHLSNRHEVENFLALGRAVWPEFSGVPELRISHTINEKLIFPARTIFCHMWPAVGKGAYLKKWPETYWAELIAKLGAKGFFAVLTGGKENRQETENFVEKYFPGKEKVQSIAGKVHLSQLAAALAKGKAMISVNTGIMHLAALLGLPTIGLHGATNPMRWGPVGEKCVSLLPRSGDFAYLNLGFEYPSHARNSLVHLPVEDVMEALEKLNIR